MQVYRTASHERSPLSEAAQPKGESTEAQRGVLLRRILGIDPGSLRTGYGIVDVRGNAVSPVAWGVIRLEGEASFPDRLFRIHRELTDLILLHRPTEAAVAKVFLAKNPSSALKLGQARGAAIVTCGTHGVAVHEYSPKEIKAAATGNGGAPVRASRCWGTPAVGRTGGTLRPVSGGMEP